MSLSAENELLIRKALAQTTAAVSEAGYILPAPLYFQGPGDFWATVDPKTDRKSIETTPIAACWIYPFHPADDKGRELGSDHSPLVNLTYEFYLFRTYDYTRADETETPDAFNKTILDPHNRFTKAWLDIKGAFQGKRNIAGLPDGIFSVAQTTSMTFPNFIENRVQCAFVKKAIGFAIRMRQMVQILEVEC